MFSIHQKYSITNIEGKFIIAPFFVQIEDSETDRHLNLPKPETGFMPRFV